MKGKLRKRRTASADKLLAATAGADSWKTWAGRHHGTDDFEILDLLRGAKRSFHKKFHARAPPPGSTCPVCYTEPEEWFVTSSCSHAVCYDCIKAYAASQIRDAEQQGPLKCPVCPQHLRTADAIAVLGDDKELVRAWDIKIRDQLLRALPSFRSCPNCQDNSGGGFVTPECLSPHHVESREDASFCINQGIPAVRCLVIVIYVSMVRYIAKHPSTLEVVDLFFMLSLVYVVVVQFGREAERHVAQRARTSFYRPISVECPCCSTSFILPSETKHLEDEETKVWLDANTRRCPSCSVPITKNGGCNHMRCSHCHASFCWQCMRLRTRCTFNRCQFNPNNSSTEEQQQPNNDSILERIDRLLAPASPSPSDNFLSVLWVVVSLFGRNIPILQSAIGLTMPIIFSIPFSMIYLFFLITILLSRAMQNLRNAQLAADRNIQPDFFGVQRMNHDPNPFDLALEQDMIAQALRRSLVEQ
mmetsp:Transcript_13855/g.20444  ORF Transcript_13855/g.20444 Transcript_13855/m.20444 type:complete len:474 (+) Transcript_13855:176-1597(+)|eukprot:CAMPEP_0194205158 /NCGR_PEP_ID=MMETSP0156-20130528/4487_1 /TAXON_ID=33649 /ORGANISM="Thalassionema nitzschioides, Strain L26-B" /LENGTH=473 /DNA_ID=CAMNT_0038931351 /DNA_START=74 /DNA_END=1495 /DNA_ORIENTATION=+